MEWLQVRICQANGHALRRAKRVRKQQLVVVGDLGGPAAAVGAQTSQDIAVGLAGAAAMALGFQLGVDPRPEPGPVPGGGDVERGLGSGLE